MFGPFTSSRPSVSVTEVLARLLVDDLRGDAGNRMADRAGLVADLRLLADAATFGRLTATTGAISVQP